jgi:hypothetical protein
MVSLTAKTSVSREFTVYCSQLSYLTMAEAVPAMPLSTLIKLYELNDHYGGSYASPMTAYQSASPSEIWTLLNNSTPLQAGAFIGMSQVQESLVASRMS